MMNQVEMLKLPFYAFGVSWLASYTKTHIKDAKKNIYFFSVNICEVMMDHFVLRYVGKMLYKKNVALNLQFVQLTEDILQELWPRLRESALKRLCVFHRVDEWWAYPQ